MNKILAAVLAAAVSVVMMGCNTFHGMGKDLERGGEKVQDTAKDVQKRM